MRLYSFVSIAALIVTLSFLLPAGPWGCSEVTRGATTSAAASNELALAYPDDLAVASITASSSSTTSLVAAFTAGGFKAATVENQAPLEKQEDIETLLAPADAAAFETQLAEFKGEVDFTATAKSVSCYGPIVYYQNHPDATGGESANGQLPPGDLGLWTATDASGEACAAAQLSAIVGNFETLVNIGTKSVAAILGANNLEGTVTSLPAKGEEKDLTTTADTAFTENSVPIDLTEATLTRAGDDNSEGFPVLMTTVTGTVTAGTATADLSMTLEHIPEVAADSLTASSEDSKYCGRLIQSVSIPATVLPTIGNCKEVKINGAEPTGITRCLLLDYCKGAATSLTYHLRTGEFCGEDTNCGTVDPTDKSTTSNPTGWANNFYYTVCTVNPVDGSGSCAQTWQAGPKDGNTLVLNVKVDAGGETGCGFFGFGPDVAAASGVGSIDRMICNWAGPGNNHTGIAKAQRQCFTKDTAGKFVSDSSNLAITYAPVNACSETSSLFAYGIQSPPTDVPGATTVTHNLVDLSVVTANFTVPTLPVVNLP